MTSVKSRKVNIAFSLLFAVLCFAGAKPSFAQTTPTTPGTPTTGSGAGNWTNTSCSFQDWMNALGNFEGGSQGYQAVNQYGYLGRYQFGTAALQDLGYINSSGNWTGKNGITSQQAFLNSPQVQDQAMQQWVGIMYGYINNANLQQYIGQNIGGCTVTMSGLLAGTHLKGVGCRPNAGGTACATGTNSNSRQGIWIWLASNGAINPTDGNNTPVSQYVCQFGGYQTPYSQASAPCGAGQPSPGGGSGGGVNNGQTNTMNPATNLPAPSSNLTGLGIQQNWIISLEFMAEQFTANMMAQLQAFGMLLDAKHQLETQRLFQQRAAQAHKDYHPSELMCQFGTFAMDLASTQRSSDVTKLAVDREILQRETGSGDAKGFSGTSDVLSRFSHFRRNYCNPEDNAGGLKLLCPTAAPKATQNLDINYTQMLDQPLTLKVDMTDGVNTPDEEALFALVDNLFMHNLPLRPSESEMDQKKFQYQYFNYRSIIAMRGIARNSIANIIAMKTESPFDIAHPGSGPYLKALMKEFGLSNTDIDILLGEHPSYYAQMEVLTKKIYQNPAFYTALYDTPTNVKRIRAAMRAIKSMQDRDIQLALQRREILLSLMLELRLRERADGVYTSTTQAIFSSY